MIDVMLLGTGAMVPLPGRHLSAVQFRVRSSLYLIDCGEGTQVAMRSFHWGFRKLDAIFLTHFHLDHVGGLPGLLHTLANSGKTDPLHIFGPEHSVEILQHFLILALPMPFEVHVTELADGDTFELPNGLRGRVASGEHRAPVLTYRFDIDRGRAFLPERAEALGVPRSDWSALQSGASLEVGGRTVQPDDVLSAPRRGVSFGIATDTRPVPSIATMMNGVDLLIAEGTYGDDADHEKAVSRGHMTFREAATLAREANVGALWLTHFGAGMTDPRGWRQNAADIFPDVTLGYSGLTGTIAFEKGLEPSSESNHRTVAASEEER